MKQFILMSDIIGSAGKNHAQLINDFEKTVNFINRKYEEEILSPLTITLGDEFQGIMKNVASSVDAIIDMEEFMIKNKFEFKLRYVLNQGEIDTPINSEISYKMLGKGLTESRKKLEFLKGSNDRFQFSLEDSDKTLIINNAFRILKNIIDRWNTEKDYDIVSAFIQFRDYKKVAEALGKNRSLIWKREKSLNLESYFSAKEILNTISKI